MPKRKTQSKSKGPSSKPQAREISPPPDDGLPVGKDGIFWEREPNFGEDKWARLRKVQLVLIDSALAKEQTSVDIKDGKQTLVLDLKSFHAKIPFTRYDERFRCGIRNAQGEDIVWEWSETRKVWTSFSPNALKILESSFENDVESNGGKVSVIITTNDGHQKQALADLTGMILTYPDNDSDATMISAVMRRNKSEAPLEDDPDDDGWNLRSRRNKAKIEATVQANGQQANAGPPKKRVRPKPAANSSTVPHETKENGHVSAAPVAEPSDPSAGSLPTSNGRSRRLLRGRATEAPKSAEETGITTPVDSDLGPSQRQSRKPIKNEKQNATEPPPTSATDDSSMSANNANALSNGSAAMVGGDDKKTRAIRKRKNQTSGESAVNQTQKQAKTEAAVDGDSKAAGGSKDPTAKGKKQEDPVESESPNKRTTQGFVITDGASAPVDPKCLEHFPKSSTVSVYSEGSDIYDVMLNQTDLRNNNNKYYQIQLVTMGGKYFVWFHWGRVGYTGQNSLEDYGSNLENAKAAFCKKFEDKTKNDWSERRSFKKYAGKYDLVQIDYKPNDEKAEALKKETAAKKTAPMPESKLDSRVQKLLELICDVQAMKDAVMEMQYDADKCPLGKLTEAQIKSGFECLKRIEECLKTGDTSSREYVDACNAFYTRIPHNYGMKRLPTIDKKMLREKIKLLEALGDIEIAIRTLESEPEENLHPLDKHYAAMKCKVEPLDPESDDFKMLNDYVQNTMGPTHTEYKMSVREAFVVEKNEAAFKDVGNKMLLCHGSRLTNWYGILSQGLKVAPPEAPVTGYMFGKGIYFADVVSKSANYCFPTKTQPHGLVLFSEVSLGNSFIRLNADYNGHNLPPAFHSTYALGGWMPDTQATRKINECTVPLGKCVERKDDKTYPLRYNEYVVYDSSQVKMKYLVALDFNFVGKTGK